MGSKGTFEVGNFSLNVRNQTMSDLDLGHLVASLLLLRVSFKLCALRACAGPQFQSLFEPLRTARADSGQKYSFSYALCGRELPKMFFSRSCAPSFGASMFWDGIP